VSTSTINPWSGGIGRYTLMLKGGMERLGHEVALLTPPVRPADARPGNWLRVLEDNAALVGAVLGQAPPDAVHAMDIYDFVAAEVLADAWRVPLVLSKLFAEAPYHHERRRGYGHFTDSESAVREHFHGYALGMEKRAIARADAVIAISAWVRDRVADSVPSAAARTWVVPLAGTVQTQPDPARVAHLRDQACRPGELLLVLPGRVVATKGGDLAVRALDALRDLPLRLVFAGGGSFQGELESLARRLDLADRVAFTGMVGHEEIVNWYQAADIILAPSRADAFPLTVADSLSLGKLVVGAAVSGILDQIRHEDNGLLFAVEDVPELAARIGWAVSHPDAAAQIARRARDTATRDADPWAAIAARTLAHYPQTMRTALSSSRRGG
jgi:glycosyltransferase involved in cell wall biosynthesis